MFRHRQKRAHASKSYNVVNEKSKTKRIEPPGNPQRTAEDVSSSVSDEQTEESDREE